MRGMRDTPTPAPPMLPLRPHRVSEPHTRVVDKTAPPDVLRNVRTSAPRSVASRGPIPGTPEWHEARASVCVNSSTMGALWGLRRDPDRCFVTIHGLWRQKSLGCELPKPFFRPLCQSSCLGQSATRKAFCFSLLLQLCAEVPAFSVCNITQLTRYRFVNHVHFIRISMSSTECLIDDN